MKRIFLALITILVIFHVSSPVLAEEIKFEDGILYQVVPYTIEGEVRYAERITDGNFSSSAIFSYSQSERAAIAEFELDESYDIYGIALKFYNGVENQNFIRFLDEGRNEIITLKAHDYDSGEYRNDQTPPTYSNVSIYGVKYIQLINEYHARNWRVYAFNVFGDTLPLEPPNTPTNLTATPGDKTVTLSWSKVEDATGYYIYMDGEKITPQAISETEHTVSGLENDVEYMFQVSAVGWGGESNLSDPVYATPFYEPPTPQSPSNIDYQEKQDEDGQKYLLITWDEVPGAVEYKIYIDGKYLDSVQAPETSYKWYDYQEGKHYNIQIVAVDEEGNESAPGKGPSEYEKSVKWDFDVLELIKVTFQFVMIFSNIILLMAIFLLAPRIVRFFKALARKHGIKF